MILKYLTAVAGCAVYSAIGATAYAQEVSQTTGHHAIERAPRSPDSPAINALREDARRLASDGRLNEAAALYELVMVSGVTSGFDQVQLANIYSQLGRPDDVLRVLDSNMHPNHGGSMEQDPGTRMLYTLALLDNHRWSDAVDVYEPTINSKPTWYIPGRGVGHILPNIHFTAQSPQYSELRAQAQLILGTAPLISLDIPDQAPFMLRHLKLALKYNPKSPDAYFVSYLLFVKAGRLSEARKALEATAKVAPYEAQAEIQSAFAELRKCEAAEKSLERHPAVTEGALGSGPSK